MTREKSGNPGPDSANLRVIVFFGQFFENSKCGPILGFFYRSCGGELILQKMGLATIFLKLIWSPLSSGTYISKI
jgi:hypothetical protein